MAKRTFLSDIDLALNQLVNARLEHYTTTPAVSTTYTGRLIYNSTDKVVLYCDGETWIPLIIDTQPHILATETALGEKHTVTGSTAGFVLRSSSATEANFAQLAHSDLNDDEDTKHRLIDDEGIAETSLYSSTKIEALIAEINTLISGALVYKGGYDASTNDPSLDSETFLEGILTGWTYVVTVEGDFFTEAVQVGDMMVSEADAPTTLGEWTIINKNIPDILDASETNKGIIQLATQEEVDAGTDTVKAVTPATLASVLSASTNIYSVNIAGDDILTTFTYTPAVMGLPASGDYEVTIKQVSDGVVVECEVLCTTGGVTLNFNVAPALAQYRMIVIG